QAHTTWLQDLSGKTTHQERREQLQQWGLDPTLTPLRLVREQIADATVVELVSAVIDALDLRTKIAAWGRSREGTAAINGLLGAATTFSTEHQLPVASNFLEYLEESAEAVTQTSQDANAIFVGTIHQSKGLEWDSV